MNQCPQGHPTSPGAAFCPTCGTPIALVVQVDDVPEGRLGGGRPAASDQTSRPPSRWARTPVIVATSILALVMVGVVTVVVMKKDESVSDFPEVSSGSDFPEVSSVSELYTALRSRSALEQCAAREPTPEPADGEEAGAEVASCAGSTQGGGNTYIGVYPAGVDAYEIGVQRFEQQQLSGEWQNGVTFDTISPDEAAASEAAGQAVDGFSVVHANWYLNNLSAEAASRIVEVSGAQIMQYRLN